MSVHSVQNSQALQTPTTSPVQPTQKKDNAHNALPQDKVTISAAAQARQTPASTGTDADHDGK